MRLFAEVLDRFGRLVAEVYGDDEALNEVRYWWTQGYDVAGYVQRRNKKLEFDTTRDYYSLDRALERAWEPVK